MATTTEVKQGLDGINGEIVDARAVLEKAIANAQIASDNLAAISTTYADVIATINGYAGGDSVETLATDQLARLTTEQDALKADADAIAGTSLS